MSKKILFAAFLLSAAQFSAAQNLFVPEVLPMVRETNYEPVNDNSNIILNNYNNEEILVVVSDIMGNDIYSKIIFKNQCAVLKAEDPYDKIPAGVYTIIACSRNEVYNQKVVVD
jgi:hypothetical protein